MGGDFSGARLKIKRAKHHINDLRARGQIFADAHPHHLSVQRDHDTGNDSLCIAPAEPLPDELLLILGDALHNLRSDLDHAWVQTVASPDQYTKFPVRKTRDDLVAAVIRLKDRASEKVKRFIVNVVQPYEGGNGKWIVGLNQLDIEDKHWLLIAHLQLTLISGLRAVDERGIEFAIDDWPIVPGPRVFKAIEGHRNFKITDYGNPRTHVIFGDGSCLKGFYVMPTLHSLTNITERVVNGLELALAAQVTIH